MRNGYRFALAFAGTLFGQSPDWTEPFPGHKIADNLYYVGSKGLASYLIVTPQGNVLINSSLESSVPLIQASVEKLGFKFGDTRIALLISHAHWDHDAGSAAVKKLTGAQYMVMDSDVPVVESGGKDDFQYGRSPENLYPAAKVDRILHDGDTVTLGGVTLTSHKTPGHTKGCTTWTMKVTDGGKTYDVVIVGSPNVNTGYKLVNNSLYPQIAQDFETTFRVLKSLPCVISSSVRMETTTGCSRNIRNFRRAGQIRLSTPRGIKRTLPRESRRFTVSCRSNPGSRPSRLRKSV